MCDVDCGSSETRRHAYVTALALCVTFSVAKQWLAWTFLKQEHMSGMIIAVSSIAKDVVQEYLSTNLDTQEQTVSPANYCN